MRLGHKGFSLVEVIVSLAIMTIVGGAVSAFLIAGNNSYIRGNRDLTLQEEAQLSTNQMIDLIIDVQNDIRFSGNNPKTTGVVIKDDGSLDTGSETDVKELTLYNDDSVLMLRWQGGSGEYANEVYLLEATNTWVDDSGSEVTEGTEGAKIKYGDVSADSASVTRSLLAQYVTDFDVDLSEVDTKRKVKLNLTFENQGKKYKVSETIKLRNTFNKEDQSQYYWISSISISPTPVTVTKGDTIQFTYTMTGDQGAIDEGVTWEYRRVDGNTLNASTSLDSSGKLYIDRDEPIGGNGGEGEANAAIEVIVKSKADPTKTASAWVSVKDPDIESITIVPAHADMMQGETLEFNCIIEGTDEVKARGANWTIEANGRPLSTGTKFEEDTVTGVTKVTLKVADNQNTGYNVIKIVAQSAAVSGSKGRAEATVTVNKYSSITGLYDVKLVATNLTTYSLNDNEEDSPLGYMATIECLPSYADYKNGYPKIYWEETTLGAAAYNLVVPEAEDDLYTGHKVPDYVAYLYCGTQINTHAYVQATVQLDAENWTTVGIDITIPNLERAISTDSAYIDSDNFVLYRQGSINLELKGKVSINGESVDVTTIDNSRITWEVANLSSYSDIINTGSYDTYGDYESRGDYTIAENGRKINYTNGVGFGRALNHQGGEVYDSDRTDYLLYPTGVGRKTTMNAERDVSSLNEYRLNVVAKVDGVQVAETNILVPRFEFLFDNGQRYLTVDAPSYHSTDTVQYDADGNITNYGYTKIVAYGYDPQEDTGGFSDSITGEFIYEKQKADGTNLDTQLGWVAKQTYGLRFYIGDGEQNDSIILRLEDPVLGPDSVRNLVIYINKKSN